MKLIKIIVLITVITLITIEVKSGFVQTASTALDIIDFGYKINDLGSKTESLIKGEDTMANNINYIKSQVQDLSRKYEAIDVKVQVMSNLIRNLPKKILFELKLVDLQKALSDVNINFRRMQNYGNLTQNLETITLDNFARSIISHEGDSVFNLMENIFSQIVPNQEILLKIETNLFDTLAKQSEELDGLLICNTQQILMHLYNIIALSELKCYIMIQYAYTYLAIHGKGNFIEERKLIIKRSSERLKIITKALQKAMPKASRDLWRSDPQSHMIDTTYVKNEAYIYFNLRSYVSNLENNMVVTGLRFQKLNNIIHLQIQQGKLLPNGAINAITLQWMPLHNYSVTDRYVFDKEDYYKIDVGNSIIKLDDLVVDLDHVITGVRFKPINDRLTLEIFCTQFDIETGELIRTSRRELWTTRWKSNSNLKSQLFLGNTNIPTESPIPSIIDSQSGMYLKFTPTRSTTVPFVDIQPVESVFPIPLSGVGIYHKGRPGYGGFIAPKIIPYDYKILVALLDTKVNQLSMDALRQKSSLMITQST